MSLKSNEKIDNYLKNICLRIKNKRVHTQIKEEYMAHIEQGKRNYIKAGLTEEEAVDKVLKEIGEENSIGDELNKVHKSSWDLIAIGITIMLIVIGILLNISWGFYIRPFFQSIIFLIIGIIVFSISIRIDYRKINKNSGILYCLGILVFLLIIRYGSNAYEGFYTGMPIEGLGISFLQLMSVLFIPAIVSIYNSKKIKLKSANIIYVLIGIIPLMAFACTGGLTGYMAYSITLLSIMFLTKIKKVYIGLTFIIEITTMLVFKIGFTVIYDFVYRVKELLEGSHQYLVIKNMDIACNPMLNYRGIALGLKNSVLFGKANNYNPDIAWSCAGRTLGYVVYRWGWVAGIVVIVIILALFYRIFKSALAVNNSFGKNLILSMLIFNFILTLWTILTAFNLLPETVGAQIIFINYGIINFVLMGVFINIYKGKTICKV